MSHVHYLQDGLRFVVPFCLCSNDGSTVYEQLPVMEEKKVDGAHCHISEDGEEILVPACNCAEGPDSHDHEAGDIRSLAAKLSGEEELNRKQVEILVDQPWIDEWKNEWKKWYERDRNASA